MLLSIPAWHGYSGPVAPGQPDRAGGSERAGGSDIVVMPRARPRGDLLRSRVPASPGRRWHAWFLDGIFRRSAAPLGAVGPGAVSAMFFNFHPSIVRRRHPRRLGHAPAASIVRARGLGAAQALCESPDVGRRPPSPDHLCTGGRRRRGSGRPLFSVNRELERRRPVEASGGYARPCVNTGRRHVAALTGAGLDGCEALVLFARSEGVPDALFRDKRGWSSDEWEEARSRLEEQGLLTARGYW